MDSNAFNRKQPRDDHLGAENSYYGPVDKEMAYWKQGISLIVIQDFL